MFRMQGPKRPDMSGLPLGFWFGWRPRDAEVTDWQRYEPTTFRWSFGFFFYPRAWSSGERIPLWRRIGFHLNGEGPIGPLTA